VNERIKFGVLTSSRADFGKIKPVIMELLAIPNLELTIFATGMHLQDEFGLTIREIEKLFKENCQIIEGQKFGETQLQGMINLLSNIQKKSVFTELDYILIHGDRIEAMAGTIASKLLGVKVIHIEGGELSGSIDDRIRHSITKFADFHFVTNLDAKKKVRQLGEDEERIWVTGSPEASVILGENIPTFEELSLRYDIPFKKYIIISFHPVVGDQQENFKIAKLIRELLNFIDENIIIIGPNSDDGFQEIREALLEFSKNNILYYPSIRFEYYLSLLKNASLVIGNSSSFVREAPLLGVQSIVPGTRQSDRTNVKSVNYVDVEFTQVINVMKRIPKVKYFTDYFGDKNSIKLITDALNEIFLSKLPKNKKFNNAK